mmetsp:Transcript_42248/g.106449  ORF Transcript_42248/g.106449 Transcript_42248/m.106449 type:complete len:139 (+) Transcript_42248:655-1071(+)
MKLDRRLLFIATGRNLLLQSLSQKIRLHGRNILFIARMGYRSNSLDGEQKLQFPSALLLPRSLHGMSLMKTDLVQSRLHTQGLSCFLLGNRWSCNMQIRVYTQDRGRAMVTIALCLLMMLLPCDTSHPSVQEHTSRSS